MKKFILMLMLALVSVVSANAQNYVSESKVFDDVSIGFKGGLLSPFTEGERYYKTVSPVIGVQIDKELTPWFGVGIDARTLLNGEGYKVVNNVPEINLSDSKTAFDAVNVSANARFNLAHIFYPSKVYRRTFEPIAYTGLGWGHSTDSKFNPWSQNSQVAQPKDDRNYMTYRAGLECNVNLGKNKAWGIYIDPSIVWGNIRDMRLDKRHSNIELLAGVKYYFKTSNGTHSWIKHSCEPIVTEVVKINEITKYITTTSSYNNSYRIQFAKNSAELTPETKEILSTIPTNCSVHITASTSPEGSEARNIELSKQRAEAVANYLTTRGIRCTTGIVEDARAAYIDIMQK